MHETPTTGEKPTTIPSNRSREWRFRAFFPSVPKTARILEIGCGDGWLGNRLRAGGWSRYVGLNLVPPADVVGDVLAWRQLGLQPRSFDVIVAFEVVEHVPCFDAMYELLADDGRCLVTTPLPAMDWACRVLEMLGINQKRTSPHSHLVYPALLGQWAVMRKNVSTQGKGKS
jgi:cyclopropane fatty-acyl-phospholipid synthase-like methyltransferase